MGILSKQFVEICVMVEKELVEVFLDFFEDSVQQCFDKYIIAKLSY